MERDVPIQGEGPRLSAAELLRQHDASACWIGNLRKGGRWIAALWAVVVVSIGTGLFVAIPGFLGILMVPQFFLPLSKEATSDAGGEAGTPT